MFWLKKERNISQILLKSRLVIKQIGLPLRGRPILLITRMITDRIGLHSVLLPLLINIIISSSSGSSSISFIIILSK